MSVISWQFWVVYGLIACGFVFLHLILITKGDRAKGTEETPITNGCIALFLGSLWPLTVVLVIVGLVVGTLAGILGHIAYALVRR